MARDWKGDLPTPDNSTDYDSALREWFHTVRGSAQDLDSEVVAGRDGETSLLVKIQIINTHMADDAKHRLINDAGSLATELFSASNILGLLGNKADLVGGLIPSNQLPSISIVDVYPGLADEAAQLALSVQVGDVAIRDDQGKVYIALNSTNASMADWALFPQPVSTILTINSKPGPNPILTVADISGAATQTAQDGIDTRLTAGEADIDSLESEVQTARGGQGNVNARLVIIEGDLTALESEVQAARGIEVDVDTRVSKIQTEVENARGLKASIDARLENVIDDNGNFLDTAPTYNAFGVQASPVRVDNSSFTVTGDLTGLYKDKLAIKALTSGADIYTKVKSSSYSSPNTTVIIADGDTLPNPLNGIQYGTIPREGVPGLSVNELREVIDTDSTMAADSDDLIPSQKAVKSAIGSVSQQIGAPTVMAQNDAITVTHKDLTGKEGKFLAQVLEFEAGATSQNTTDIISQTDESKWDFEEKKGTNAYFQVDTANTHGHFEDSGNLAVSIGSSGTEDKVLSGVFFKLVGDAQIYAVRTITNDGDGDSEVEFVTDTNTAATKAMGTYTIEWIRGIWINDSDEMVPTILAEYNDVRDDIDSITAGSNITGPVADLITAGNTDVRPTASASGEAITMDFGAGDEKAISKIDINCDTPFNTFDIQFSDNGSSWSTVVSNWTPGQGWTDVVWAQKTAHRYWRLLVVTGVNGRLLNMSVFERKFSVMSQDFYNVALSNTAIDTTHWQQINSGAITGSENDGESLLALSFDSKNSYSIFTGSEWRRIVRDNAGTWQFNNDATGDETESWVNAVENTIYSAIREALVAQSSNQMDQTVFEAIVAVGWAGSGGFDISQTSLYLAVIQRMVGTGTAPTVTNFSMNYDLDGHYRVRSLGGSGADFRLERVDATTSRFIKQHAGAAASVICSVS